MKKFIRIAAIVLALFSTLSLLCSCGSKLDRAVKDADEVIAARNEGSGYPDCEFSAELVYYEDKDCYDYVISVEYGDSTKSADSIVYGLKQNIDGYFDDIENADVVIKFYIQGAQHLEYRNWELVK